jgi:hypothetical protein
LNRPDDDPPLALIREDRRAYAPPKERVTGKLIAQLFGMILLFVAAIIFLMSDSSNDTSGASDTQRILSWSRMNPLPQSATNVHVVAPEEAPDHQYTLSFVARERDIESWLKSSPGTEKLSGTANGILAEYSIPAELNDKELRPARVIWKRNAGMVAITVAAAPISLDRSSRRQKSP